MRCARPVIRALSNRGNIIQAEISQIRAHAIQTLGLKKRIEEKLPSPPDGYIFESPALSLLRTTYVIGDGDQIKNLAIQYDAAQATLPENQRHQQPYTTQGGIRLIKASSKVGNFVAINRDDLTEKLPVLFSLEKRLSPPPEGYSSAIQALKIMRGGHGSDNVQKILLAVLREEYDEVQATLPEDQRHTEPYQTKDKIRVIKAFSGITNFYYYNEEDLKNHAHLAIGIEKRYAPPPTGFPSRNDVSRELKSRGFNISISSMRKSYDKLEREYEEYQQTLSEDRRHKEPYTTQSGVRVIRAHRSGQNLLCASEPEIYDFLIADLGLQAPREPRRTTDRRTTTKPGGTG